MNIDLLKKDIETLENKLEDNYKKYKKNRDTIEKEIELKQVSLGKIKTEKYIKDSNEYFLDFMDRYKEYDYMYFIYKKDKKYNTIILNNDNYNITHELMNMRDIEFPHALPGQIIKNIVNSREYTFTPENRNHNNFYLLKDDKTGLVLSIDSYGEYKDFEKGVYGVIQYTNMDYNIGMKCFYIHTLLYENKIDEAIRVYNILNCYEDNNSGEENKIHFIFNKEGLHKFCKENRNLADEYEKNRLELCDLKGINYY